MKKTINPTGSMERRSFVQILAIAGVLPLTEFSAMGQGHESASTDLISEWPQDNDPNFWRGIRAQFSMPMDEAYFNTGTVGACPRQVVSAVIDSMRTMEQTIAQYDYRPEHVEYIAGYRPQEELRKKAGAILGAEGKDVALTQNATMGLNFIANGLALNAGDEVLLTDQEHPGAISPWQLREKRQGIVVKQVPVKIPALDGKTIVKAFADAIGPRTKVMAVPHITSKHGIVMPARELCDLARERGLFSLIDGAQAIGQLRFNAVEMGCDAYACSPHKWLLAPPGNGLLYVNPKRQAEIWATLASSQWNNYAPESGVFRLMQFGTANAALLAGLDSAIDFYQRLGPEKIERRIVGLANQLRAGLRGIKGVTITSPTNPALAGAIVTYGITGLSGQKLQDELWARKKYRVRWQGDILVRQSVHLYNSSEEINGTLEVVKSLAKS